MPTSYSKRRIRLADIVLTYRLFILFIGVLSRDDLHRRDTKETLPERAIEGVTENMNTLASEITTTTSGDGDQSHSNVVFSGASPPSKDRPVRALGRIIVDTWAA